MYGNSGQLPVGVVFRISLPPTADKLKCICNALGIPGEAWANLGLNFCEVNVLLDANDVVDCPWCFKGMAVHPLPGEEDWCSHCGSFGLTLRHVRCHCGRQVNLTQQVKKGVFYCGRPTCSDAIKKALGIGKSVVGVQHQQHATRTPGLFESCT